PSPECARPPALRRSSTGRIRCRDRGAPMGRAEATRSSSPRSFAPPWRPARMGCSSRSIRTPPEHRRTGPTCSGWTAYGRSSRPCSRSARPSPAIPWAPGRGRRAVPRRIPPELARRVRLVALDVDGVLTDNGVYIGRTQSGEAVELKKFDITDGIGIGMLRSAGLPVALVSGRESEATRIRAEELKIPCYQDSSAKKLPALERLMAEHGVDWEHVAFVGDDLADLAVLARVGLPVAVANAVPEVRALAVWQTRRPGGRGAVREFAEALLKARGEWSRLVVEYQRSREVKDPSHER